MLLVGAAAAVGGDRGNEKHDPDLQGELRFSAPIPVCHRGLAACRLGGSERLRDRLPVAAMPRFCAFVPTDCPMFASLHRPRSSKDRSKLIVDREVQYGVARKVALHWIAFVACNACALLMWVRLFDQPDLSWSESVRASVSQYFPFIIVSLALVPAFILDTLKMTNRFAGPISRLRTEMSRAASGQPVKELHFRSDDYWREIATGFNELVRRAGPSSLDAAATGSSTSSPTREVSPKSV